MERVVYDDLLSGEPTTLKCRLSTQDRFLLAKYRPAGISDVECRGCKHERSGGTQCLKYGTIKYPLKIDPHYTCDSQRDKNLSGRKKPSVQRH